MTKVTNNRLEHSLTNFRDSDRVFLSQQNNPSQDKVGEYVLNLLYKRDILRFVIAYVRLGIESCCDKRLK